MHNLALQRKDCLSPYTVGKTIEERTVSRGCSQKFWQRTCPSLPRYSWRHIDWSLFRRRLRLI